MEHIFHSHIIKHIDKLGLLADSQHGFRKRRSTETQLILSIDDLAKCLDEGEQMDSILLDFFKAFDKAPHSRLLMKLQLYGVRGYLHDWITSLPLGRTQCVVLDGPSSAATTVSSGVSQVIVLGPLLLLFFINDLSSVVSSTTRLFADDCLPYRRVRTTEDQAILQRDLDNFQQWEKKCEMLIATNKSPIHSEYTINGQVLNQTDSAKYLGLNIHKSLSWDRHIDKMTKKANSTLALLGRNVSRCPTTIKAVLYHLRTTYTRICIQHMEPQQKRQHQQG